MAVTKKQHNKLMVHSFTGIQSSTVFTMCIISNKLYVSPNMFSLNYLFWQHKKFLLQSSWFEKHPQAFYLNPLNKYKIVTDQEVWHLRWLWTPGQCCPAAVRCTQPVCAACLAPAPSPGHCRICQQASGSARSSRSYQGLQQANTQQRAENDEWEKTRAGTANREGQQRKHYVNVCTRIIWTFRCVQVQKMCSGKGSVSHREHNKPMYSVTWCT